MGARVITEEDLRHFTRNGARVRGGESKTPAAGERSVCTPSGLRGNRSNAEAATRALQNGPSPSHRYEYQGQVYKSKTEVRFAMRLDAEKFAGEIKAFWYEPFSLWLPGGVRYKPDFLIQYPTPGTALKIIEVKGWSKNRRDGVTRLKIAASLFPCFSWGMAGWDKGVWNEISVG